MGRKDAIDRTAVEDRRRKVAHMYLEGHVQYTIATILRMSQAVVSRDLDHIRKEWLESRVKDYDERLAKEVAGLDYQESQLWEAWHNSCKQEVVHTITRKKMRPTQSGKGKSKRGRKDDDAVEQSDDLIIVEENDKTTKRQLFGDPRFMTEITKVRELRCRLTGLLEDKPLDAPIVNIWQQLQDLSSVRDNDPIEERLLELEGRTDVGRTLEGRTVAPGSEDKGQSLGRPVVKASDLPDPTPEPTSDELKQRSQEQAIKKHLNLDWFDTPTTE